MMLSVALIRYVNPILEKKFSSANLKIPSLAEWGMGLAPLPKAYRKAKPNEVRLGVISFYSRT